MDHLHLHRVRTLVLVAAGIAAVTLAPRLVLLTLGVGVALLVGAVLLGALAFWAMRRQVRRVLLEQQATFATDRVVDGEIVEAR
ncbi:MAG: hypothetical protein WCD35_07070 [Mycobacteriales bacterium]